jgi:hypothetical protein
VKKHETKEKNTAMNLWMIERATCKISEKNFKNMTYGTEFTIN